MNIELIYCFLFFLCFVLILVFCEILYKKGLPVEYTRKIAHSLSTLLCLSVPFCFSSYWYALLFVVGAVLILAIGRKKQRLKSIHAVGRKTYGAYLLPVSIGITYYLSLLLHNNLFFVLPVVILAISDSLACCFGQICKSKVLKSGKTLIGTLAFFLSTLVICTVILFHQSIGIKMAAIAFGISLIVTVVELMSPNGSDNLTIPLSAIAALVLFDVV